MSKQKQQGTRLESQIAKVVNGERLAEGGANDRGDVRFYLNDVEFIVECKARQSLNVTRELAKAIKKSKAKYTALVWKRLVKTDKKVRQPDGVSVVVCIDLDTFVDLVDGKRGNSFYDDPFWKQLP